MALTFFLEKDFVFQSEGKRCELHCWMMETYHKQPGMFILSTNVR